MQGLYEFAKNKKTENSSSFDHELKKRCLIALSVIPHNLPELLKDNWSEDVGLRIGLQLPEQELWTPLKLSKYEKQVKDFILEMLARKYGRHGWEVMFMFGEMRITFDPEKYEYYKHLLTFPTATDKTIECESE